MPAESTCVFIVPLTGRLLKGAALFQTEYSLNVGCKVQLRGGEMIKAFLLARGMSEPGYAVCCGDRDGEPGGRPRQFAFRKVLLTADMAQQLEALVAEQERTFLESRRVSFARRGAAR